MNALWYCQEQRQDLLKLFLEDDQMPSPEVQEYVLRTVAPQPRPSARPGAHRLYAKISENEFIINGAYSYDAASVL